MSLGNRKSRKKKRLSETKFFSKLSRETQIVILAAKQRKDLETIARVYDVKLDPLPGHRL